MTRDPPSALDSGKLDALALGNACATLSCLSHRSFAECVDTFFSNANASTVWLDRFARRRRDLNGFRADGEESFEIVARIGAKRQHRLRMRNPLNRKHVVSNHV